METELEKFRNQKRKQERHQKLKERIVHYVTIVQDALMNAVLPNQNDNDEQDEDAGINTATNTNNTSIVSYVMLAMKILIWMCLFIGFISIGFGAVYFAISLLCIIYWNTKTTKRKKGEISAYSVFNENCESIDGTLKAEHLEKQLLFKHN